MTQSRPNLSHYNASYRRAEIADGYASVSDGLHKALIRRIDVRKTQGDTLYIGWELEVALSGSETVVILKTSFLSDKAMSMLKRDLKMIGIDPSAIEPFERIYQVFDYLEGAVIEFEQKTKQNDTDPSRPYVNQNFQRLIRESGKPFPDMTAPMQTQENASIFPQSGDDELPF